MEFVTLLDTNAYVALKKGHSVMVDRIRKSDRVIISVVVLGELLFGFRHGSRYDKNVQELNQFLDHPMVTIKPVSEITADRFGRIACDLRRQGTPIPSNDIWIAAHAMETGAELLTLDGHFEKIPGLAVTWVQR